ncbi:EAL domain-containing protein [bacterium]|nr:EAL domain-containing protein [bacterium]
MKKKPARTKKEDSQIMLRRLEKAVETMNLGMTITDTDCKILFTNHAEAELHGYEQSELTGKEARILAPHAFWNPPSFENIKQMQSWRREAVNVRKDGTPFPVQLISEVIFDDAGEPMGIVTICEDITERKRVEEQLERQALYDTLTQLPNRTLFNDRLSQAVSKTKRRKDYSFGVLFLDLDRFKLINDSLGHTVGDQLLVELAQRLFRCLRPGDTIARVGGDEFTILLDDIHHVSDATRVADRIQQELNLPFKLGQHEVFTTASMGIALSSEEYGRSDDLLRDADIAMYRAKAHGRARYQVFDSGMHTTAVLQLQMENDLRRALERKEFRAFYQPTVCLFTGKLTGFEALMRWQHPERGLILPEEFIPLAEETGLIIPMGLWILKESCEQMQRWATQFPTRSPLTISVNLSGVQIAEQDLVPQIEQVLMQTGINPNHLTLEMTESVFMAHPQEATSKLLQLRSLGVRLHIDDFGTGYSSLSYLHQLPVDTLKIDRSFVSRIGKTEKKGEIVGTIATLAHNLGMEVIAEGVETATQLLQVKALACESAQGFYFSRPMASRDAETLILAETSW